MSQQKKPLKRIKKPMFVAALSFFAAMSVNAAGKRPNIVIILSDDSGYADLGCYGGEIDTPNLDKWASNALRFRTFLTMGVAVRCEHRA